MADSTTDHEAVLTVAPSLVLCHISQLAVLMSQGRTGGGDVELGGDLVTPVVATRQ